MFLKIRLLIPAILLIALSIRAQEPLYRYAIDLGAIEDDQVQVELLTPPVDDKIAVFYLPKIVPGTYSVYDFGRFVSDLEAYDEAGQPLTVVRRDVNTWEIQDARRLYRLTYRVDDSDDGGDENPVAGMSGTSIGEGEYVVLNTFGFFGYFEDRKEWPVELTVRHPAAFYGATALIDLDPSETTDRFRADDYHHFADSPLLYGRPDTAVIQVANAEVLIAVNAPEGAMVTAQLLADEFDDLLLATSDYLGGRLPVDRYAFLLHLREQSEVNRGTGALEHSYSSLYYLPNMPPVPQVMDLVRDIAAHEFFHILQPLNLHSEEIHYFDFNDPDMSRHLWLYEGVTEYFSHHVQVYQGLQDAEMFREKLEQKLADSQLNYDDDLAFTTLSEGSLDEHKDEYGNVYQKGALIGACLDIELREWSDGRYGLRDLVADMTGRFGPEKPFRDKRLFKEIARVTDREIGRFLQEYVGSDKALPYGEIFARVGWAYTPPGTEKAFTIGNVSLGYNPERGRIYIANTSELNEVGRELGYQVSDELIRINSREMPQGNFGAFFDEVKAGMVEGEPLEIVVLRGADAGAPEEVTLRATTRKVDQPTPPQLREMDNPTRAQLELRAAWLNLDAEGEGSGSPAGNP